MIAHQEYRQLLQRICACRNMGCPWNGIIYRSSRLKYAKRSTMLSGQGSLENGGRWNAPGAFLAIYGSLTPETALSEALEHTRYFGLKGHTAFPRGIVAIEVKVTNLLDLTSGIIRKHLLVSQERMLIADWRNEQDEGKEALPQTLGRAAYRVGFEAMLIPSKADLSGTNLVVFPENLKSNSSVTCLNETDLPD